MAAFKYPFFLMLVFFGSTLFADCEFYPINDFRNFGVTQRGQEDCCPTPDCLPSDECWLANQLEFTAVALYWRPSYPGCEYAVDISNTPNNVPIVVEPDWNWGYRIAGRLKTCSEDFYIDGAYLNYRQSNESSATGTLRPIFSQLVSATTAFSRVRSKYETADISLGYRWLESCRCESSIFGGARFFNINEIENAVYTVSGNLQFANRKFRSRGWGPRLGLDVACRPFTCGWLAGFGVRGLLAQLAGIASESQEISIPPSAPFSSGFQSVPVSQALIFNTDMQLEAFYRICFLCMQLQVRGGYEFNLYSNTRALMSVAANLGDETVIHEALGYGGPYIGFNLFW